MINQYIIYLHVYNNENIPEGSSRASHWSITGNLACITGWATLTLNSTCVICKQSVWTWRATCHSSTAVCPTATHTRLLRCCGTLIPFRTQLTLLLPSFICICSSRALQHELCSTIGAIESSRTRSALNSPSGSKSSRDTSNRQSC